MGGARPFPEIARPPRGASDTCEKPSANRSPAFDFRALPRKNADFRRTVLKRTADKPRAPSHLRPETRHWFEHVTDEFALEQHHVRLLTLGGTLGSMRSSTRETLA